MATATGVFHRSYASELRLRHTKAEYVRLGLVAALALAMPWLVGSYWLGVVNTVLIAIVGATGLNILVGFTGQISLGQGGFLAVGAFTSAVLTSSVGLPVPLSIVGAVLMTAAVGAMFGIPALRLKGLYLAIATLAAQIVIVSVVRRWDWLTDGRGFLDVPRLEIAGFRIDRMSFEYQWYWILLTIVVLVLVTARNLFRTSTGRALMAVRDQDIAASAMGIDVTRTKIFAFAVSSGYVGLAGALTAHYTETVTWERFTLEISVSYLAMILVGGLGTIAGSVYGAIFVTTLPSLLSTLSTNLRDSVPFISQQLPAIQNAVFGAVIIAFLLFEPRGIDYVWSRIRAYFGVWPFRY